MKQVLIVQIEVNEDAVASHNQKRAAMGRQQHSVYDLASMAIADALRSAPWAKHTDVAHHSETR